MKKMWLLLMVLPLLLLAACGGSAVEPAVETAVEPDQPAAEAVAVGDGPKAQLVYSWASW